jgi:hypothetical protein
MIVDDIEYKKCSLITRKEQYGYKNNKKVWLTQDEVSSIGAVYSYNSCSLLSYSETETVKAVFDSYTPYKYDPQVVGSRLKQVGGYPFINFHFEEDFKIPIPSNIGKLESNDKLLFLTKEFPIRKLQSFVKNSSLENVKVGRSLESCNKVVMQYNNIKKYFGGNLTLKTGPYSFYNSFLTLDIKQPNDTRRLRHIDLSNAESILFLNNGLSYFNSETIKDIPMLDKRINEVLAHNGITTDFTYEARLYISMNCFSDYYSPDFHNFIKAAKTICDPEYFNIISKGVEVIDIADLYASFGKKVMDYETYKSIVESFHKALSSGDSSLVKMLSESLTSYDLKQSIFYVTLLCQQFSESIGRGNTNVKSLLNHCINESLCENKRVFEYTNIVNIAAGLRKSGYNFKIPLSLLVDKLRLVSNLSNVSSMTSSNPAFKFEVSVSIKESVYELIDVDINLNDVVEDKKKQISKI